MNYFLYVVCDTHRLDFFPRAWNYCALRRSADLSNVARGSTLLVVIPGSGSCEPGPWSTLEVCGKDGVQLASVCSRKEPKPTTVKRLRPFAQTDMAQRETSPLLSPVRSFRTSSTQRRAVGALSFFVPTRVSMLKARRSRVPRRLRATVCPPGTHSSHAERAARAGISVSSHTPQEAPRR